MTTSCATGLSNRIAVDHANLARRPAVGVLSPRHNSSAGSHDNCYLLRMSLLYVSSDVSPQPPQAECPVQLPGP